MARRKRRIGGDDLDITPMIDVTFLLLIFFMVTSTMQATPELDQPPARHGEGINANEAAVLTLIAGEGGPEIYLGDTLRGASSSLEDVTAYVQQQADEGRTIAVIKAEQDLPSGFVEQVARAAGQVEQIEKFYVGVRDKRSQQD